MMKPRIKLRPEEKRIVDIGPGRLPKKDANIFVDKDYNLIKHLPNPIVWDLNKIPYPFEDDSIDKVYLSSVLEHLEVATADVMKEMWRILKFGGIVVLTVPNTYFIVKRLQFLFGILHNNFRPQHRKYVNYSFIRHTVKE
ncbi:MAG: methyltransferase domain-containing protein, partial [Candidatus Nanoarchaeia archaeon]